MANDKIYICYDMKNKKKMKYFDHKSFFYCHCGFSLQRTETFHKVFDADDYYIGMCHYSWQQQQNYKKQT